jgi:hypothetical protein
LTTPVSADDSKGTHFCTEDDEGICIAYYYVSDDGAKGANRTGADFWTEVARVANVMYVDQGRAERSIKSLKHRFQRKIQPAVLAFKPYHKEAMKAKESGWDEDMYENYALELWKGDEGKDYMFIECSRILKAMPKYDWEAEPVPEEVDATLATSGPMGGEMLRPDGTKKTKAAKAKGRKKGPESVISLDLTTEQTINVVASNSDRLGDEFARIVKNQEYMSKKQELFMKFQCLIELGKKEEADLVYQEMCRHALLHAKSQELARAPAKASTAELLESSDDDSMGLLLPMEPPAANAKADEDYESDECVGDTTAV